MKTPTLEQFAADNDYRITAVKIIKSDTGEHDDRMVTLKKDARTLVIDSELFADVARSVTPVTNSAKDSPIRGVA